MGTIQVRPHPQQRSPEHRDAVCRQKARYSKLGAAKKEAKRLIEEKKIEDLMTVYRCEFCRGWHIGKATRTILARLRVVDAGEP